ncbi:hypothetical protein B0J12DRAFT_447511 [Macrophomina phaseolina]|uniref:Uncharacterized protein n=1 Tax=Macrophomina phaseolina TaxID=35725 RepID=A0ABQ8GEY2_9PEZI|nr:hypothetical protein B0J12DRAFT_447511 [Macrophomina phaseolina]
MDDWGDPWKQDDAGPKHPPAIDIRILNDHPSKERVVTPVLSGFFEDQAKWNEPASSDVWATANNEPSPPLKPAAVAEALAWDVPSLASADEHDLADARKAEAPPPPLETDGLQETQPLEEAGSEATVESLSHEPTPSSDTPEESGGPLVAPTAPEIDSSDSGTTVGPDFAGGTATDTSAPLRPHSEEFESGISTRPSTSPSELSHGDVFSDSTRTSFDEDIEPQSPTGNGQHKEGTAAAEESESEESPAESRTVTPAPIEDVPKRTSIEGAPDEIEVGAITTAEDRLEDVSAETHEDLTGPRSEDIPEDAFDDDDFGDFEEEAEDEELHEEPVSDASSPVDSGPTSPANGHASALDQNESAPTSPRPFVKADFTPDTSLLEQLFPAPKTKAELSEVDDSPIKPTSARKIWYRLTRVETLHELTSGKSHDNYVRVGWQGSAVRSEVNQVVGRWASEDRINGRTLLGGKPGAMFGWDYPMSSPASSIFSVNSHKRNASAAPTPKKAAFDLEEAKQRPMSLTVPSPRKPSISSAIEIPQFSWSSQAEDSKESAALSAPPSKTAFNPRPSSNSSNPWAGSSADKVAPHTTIVPISAPPVKTTFEEKVDSAAAKTSFEGDDAWKSSEPFEEKDAWKSAKLPVEEDDAWKPSEPSIGEADAWGSAKKSFEESAALQPRKKSFEDSDAWKSTRKSSEEADAWNSEERPSDEADAWKSSRTSVEEAEAWKSAKESEQAEEPPQPPQRSLEDLSTDWEPVKNSQDKIIGWKPNKASSEKSKNQRPPHTRTVSDSGVLNGPSPFDNPFASSEPEKPVPDETEQPPTEGKKKKRLSWLTFPRRKKNDLAHKRSVSTASFLTVSGGLSVPAKSESLPSWDSPWARTAPKSPLANEASLPEPEPEIARKEHEPEIPLRKHEPNPWDNAFDNAWARPPTAKSGSSHNEPETSTSKPTLPAINTTPRPPSPKFEAPAQTPALPPVETNIQSPEAEIPSTEEKSWGGMVESPMASPAVIAPDENPWGDPWKPTIVEPAPVTVSVEPPSASKPSTKLAPLDTNVQSHSIDDDDDWGEMVESPAASSPVIAPPPSSQPGLPRSISPINLPMRLASPPRMSTPKSTSTWLPKPTSPRPLSPLNPARSSTLPVSQSASTASLASPWLPQPNEIQATLSSTATSTANHDPWGGVDLSIFDKPTASDLSSSSRNRTSSTPTFPSDSKITAASSSGTPVITFDSILGGGNATRTDRSSSSPLTFDDILQPGRKGSGSAKTFDDILAGPGSLSPATSQNDLRAAAADQAQNRTPSPITAGWTEKDKEAVQKFVAALPDFGYMLR